MHAEKSKDLWSDKSLKAITGALVSSSVSALNLMAFLVISALLLLEKGKTISLKDWE